MSIWWYISTILLSAAILFSLSTAVNLIRGMIKCKEKAIIINLTYLLMYALAFAAGICLIILNKNFRIPCLLFSIEMLLSAFCLCTVLTKDGMLSPKPLGYAVIPREELSYEYSQEKICECVKLYRKNAAKPSVYHLGIKKPKTVKLFADWFGKHDCENPLTK